tara:strand:- start:272 stop:1999 length:1728 start_codon:yes stop_codon:yes gene_type:complete
MGKLSSTLGTLGKAAKRVSKSKVVRKTAIAGKKAIRGAKKGIAGAQVKGSNFLQKSVAKIKPIAADLKQGGIRKINKIVESKAQNLIPKLSNKIEEKVNSFDPSKFLGKIFDGGLNSLNQFGSSLDGMKGRFDSTVEFIGKATELASKFVKKLASAKPKKGGGGGIFGKLIKGVAIAGAAALGTAVVAKVAVAGKIREGAKSLVKKGLDFIRNRKKKKLEKKQEEAKVKKDKGNANIFKNILDKFSSILDFDGRPKKVKKFIKEGKTDYQDNLDEDGYTEDYRFRRFNSKDNKIHDLKVSFKDGQDITGSGDDEVTKKIIKIKNEIMDLEEEYDQNLEMGKRDDDDKKAAEEMLKKIRELEKELTALIPLAKNTSTVEGTKENLDKVMNDPAFVEEGKDGKDGKDGKSKPGQIFNNIKNTFGGLKEKAGNFLGGIKKALTPKKGGSGGRKKGGIERVQPGKPIEDPISFANDSIQQAESVKPSTKKKDAASDVADGISTPAKGGSGSGGQGALANINVASGADKRAAQEAQKASRPSMDREFVKPQNQIPALMAIDKTNMHVLHAKSVFNIVDAL